MPNLNATLDADQFLDGNAHFVEVELDTPEGVKKSVYALIPIELLSEQEIRRIQEIKQMNYPDKSHKK